MTTNNSIVELNLFPVEEEQNSSTAGQQITIFYNGNVCVSDVTQLQAKAILMLARRERVVKSGPGSSSSSSSSSSSESPSCDPNGLSMKKSLQRFLHKRNHRIQSTFPYNISRRHSCFLPHH
ncbi:jasmonate-zim-domain protein 7 [Euphorbia peplus]|nr:jasmonate-zim-domain protein 7 [Euphorbia peplus]